MPSRQTPHTDLLSVLIGIIVLGLSTSVPVCAGTQASLRLLEIGPQAESETKSPVADPIHGVWSEFPVPGNIYTPNAVHDAARRRAIVFGHQSLDIWALSLAPGSERWDRFSPPGNPGVRYGTAVLDPNGDRIILVGGAIGERLVTDVWQLSLAGDMAWTRLVPVGSGPSPRRYPTSIYDAPRRRMIVFGGEGSNEVWALSLESTPRWSQLMASGTPPVGRTHARAVYDPNGDRMVIFGGWTGTSGIIRLNDTWELSLSAAPTWRKLEPTGDVPSPRAAHSAIYDLLGARLLIFGGSDLDRATYSLSLGAEPVWNRLETGQLLPPPLSRHDAVFDPDGKRMVTIGGNFPNADRVWTLDLDGPHRWSPLDLAPGARTGHGAVYDPERDRTLIVGGVSEPYLYAHEGPPPYDRQLWAFSQTGSWIWEPVRIPEDWLLERDALAVERDPACDRLIVVGGERLFRPGCNPYDPSVPSYYGDTWTIGLSPQSCVRTLPASGLSAGHSLIRDPLRRRLIAFGGASTTYFCDHSAHLHTTYSQSLVELSLEEGGQWTPLVAAGDPPAGRSSHSAVYDSDRDRMIVFGGHALDLLSDLWSLSLSGTPTWERLQPVGRQPPRFAYHAALYDPARERMVVWGQRADIAAGEVWALALNGSLEWTQLTPAGPGPRPSCQYCSVEGYTVTYDPTRDGMVIFGGETSDTWVLSWGAPLLHVAIDVNGARAPAVVNPGSKRLLSVALMSSSDFDARLVDVASLELDGATVAVGGNGMPLAREEDANRDGLTDLVVLMPVEDMELERPRIRLDGRTSQGRLIRGYTKLAYVPKAGGSRAVDSHRGSKRFEFALHRVEPNPSLGDRMVVRYSLSTEEPATLEVLDVAGRLITTEKLGAPGPGAQARVLRPGLALPGGIYFVRLRQAGRVAIARATVIR